MGNNKTFSLVIRLIAGAYIIYLGYQLIKGVVSGESQENQILFIIFAVVFIVLGAFIIIDAVRKYIIKESDTAEEDSEEGAENQIEEAAGTAAIEDDNANEASDTDEKADESEEEIPHTMTIAERIARLSDEKDDDAGRVN